MYVVCSFGDLFCSDKKHYPKGLKMMTSHATTAGTLLNKEIIQFLVFVIESVLLLVCED